jgi:hypothetical protein
MQYTSEQIVAMTGRELATLFNSLVPEGEQVRKFSDHKTGVRRVLATLGQPLLQAPATPAPEPETAQAPQPAPTPAIVEDATSKPKRKPKGAPRVTLHKASGKEKPPRPESKRGQLLAILRGAGITIEAMQTKFDWKPTDCRDALRLLAKQNGIGVERGEDGRWRIA